MSVAFDNTNTQKFNSASSFTPGVPGTVMYWSYSENLSGNHRIVGRGTNYESRTSGTSMLHEYYQNSQPPNQTVTLNTWHHWSFVWDGTNKGTYRDGVELVFGVYAHNAGPSSGTLSIGASSWQASSEYFNGRLDDVRIYDSALSANIIKTIYHAHGGDSFVDGLLHRWELRGGSPGANAANQNDHSGSLNMNVVGTPSYDELKSYGRRR